MVEKKKNNLTELPIKFGIINGDFDCSKNILTSLKGSPSQVNGNFYCNNNELKSLEHGPKKVGGNFNCSVNNLTNLDFSPITVTGYYNFQYNDKVTTTKYITRNCRSYKVNDSLPKEIKENINLISTIISNQYAYTIWRDNELNLVNYYKLIRDIEIGKAH